MIERVKKHARRWLAVESEALAVTQQNERAPANTGKRRAGGWREYLNRAVRFGESHPIRAKMALQNNLVDHRAQTGRRPVEVLEDWIRQGDGNSVFRPDRVSKVAATSR
jgi:hypothetical protein